MALRLAWFPPAASRPDVEGLFAKEGGKLYKDSRPLKGIDELLATEGRVLCDPLGVRRRADVDFLDDRQPPSVSRV